MENTEFATEISKEELDKLPVKHFEGNIVLVDNLFKLNSAVSYLKEQKLLGFDTETKPSFQRGRTHKTALLQLATDEIAFLFRLHHTGLPFELAAIMSNPSIIKVGAAINDDIRGLNKLHHFHPASFVDIQTIAKQYNIKMLGLKKITAIFLGFVISKGQQLSNWENAELTVDQQRYAATDAWVCYKIYQKIMNQSPKTIV